MYSLEAKDKHELKGKGTVYYVDWPVVCKRNMAAMKEAIGSIVEIDGVEYKPIAFDVSLIVGPLRVGENVGILV